LREIEKLFAADGELAKLLGRYESRPQQLTMAQGVGYAADNNRCALIEAGTGCGKSLGYLTPILARIEDHRITKVEKPGIGGETKIEEHPTRLIISTGTLTLQKQLLDKELPMLKKVFPWLTYAMSVGTENYLCGCRLHRAVADAVQNPMLLGFGDDLKMISEWSTKTQTGLRMDLPKPVDHVLWSAVNRQSDLCKCKEFTDENLCFYRRARARMAEAHVIVVNHHLLMLGLTIENAKILPDFDYLVIDEIHQLEEVAAQCFGIEVSNLKVDRLVEDSRRFFRSVQGKMERADEAREILDRVESGAESLFDMMKAKMVSEQKDALRLRQPLLAMDQLQHVELITQMQRVGQWLGDAVEYVEDEQKQLEISSLSKRAVKLADETRKWLTQAESDHVYQIVSELKGRRLIAKSCPIDIAPYLRGSLWGLGIPVIGTSATISTGRSMEFMKKKLGAEVAEEMVLDSPFEYDKNALIYVASDLPEVKGAKQDPAYYKTVTDRIVELLTISRGRAMVLCTSNYAMKTLGASLKVMVPELKFMVQGEDLERHRMVEELKSNPKSVIVATSSFWQGVDIAGDALTMVVIVKLPYPNPSDPLFEARSEKIDREAQALDRRQQFMAGSFMSLSVPETIIKLKQGFGRLIRTNTDWGCVAVLDSRFGKKVHGKLMVQSLPRTYIVEDLANVRDFFEKRRPTMGSEAEPAIEVGAPPVATECIDECPF